jgi:DNA anti-recombination protein RmuC
VLLVAVELTLENLRQAVREEIRGEFASLHNEVGALQKDVGALNEKVISAQGEMTAFRVEVSGQFTEVKQSVEGVRTMLEEDAHAESARLSRVDRRSLKTQRLLTKHLTLHAGE